MTDHTQQPPNSQNTESLGGFGMSAAGKETAVTEQGSEVLNDSRTSAERIEDLAFENRLRFLTHHRRWDELKMVQLVYASALADREHPPTESSEDLNVVHEGEIVNEDEPEGGDVR